jgi:putative transposase
MRKSKFTEQQIAFILKQADDGVSVEDTCRKVGSRSRRTTAGGRCTVG